jgi:RNA polymerase-binding transcription factor DksA
LEALRRIERGTYGICEISGEPIEEKRLQAIPWATITYGSLYSFTDLTVSVVLP